MSNIESLKDFLEPVNLSFLSDDEGFRASQIGSKVAVYEDVFPDVDNADVIIAGCGENRGSGTNTQNFDAANVVRKHFYSLFHWHKNISVADIGNISIGKKINDSRIAIETVLADLSRKDRKLILIGGSHDNTVAQSNAFKKLNRLHQIITIDAKIDLDKDSPKFDDNYLLDLFTQSPNFIKHYNHIGFQSYFVHPDMLETIDKLRFDCFRVGKVKEDIEEMEPVIRNSHLVSFDINAIAHAYAPANTITPNGLNGEEACILMQYAGMSPTVQSIGIYGYYPQQDRDELTAKQISHMLWYFIDGKHRGLKEASFDNRDLFNEYQMAFAEIETSFLQSKKTNRWWMQLPDKSFIACSYKDYLTAGRNEIPERWFRAQQR